METQAVDCAHVLCRLGGECKLDSERSGSEEISALNKSGSAVALGVDPSLLLSVAQAEKSRRRLAHFVRYSWDIIERGTPLVWNWHIEAIADHIQWMLEDWAKARSCYARSDGKRGRKIQRSKNLLINVPPGSLKSRILSVCAPAWAWLHWPDFSVLCLSANPTVADRDASSCRDLIESPWYRSLGPKFRIRTDHDAKRLFKNSVGGWRAAKGLNAKVTGERADALFIDDPHDAQEASSDAKRQGVLDRWKYSAANRVNDKRYSIRIGIMQRLHEMDWSGYLLDTEPKDWVHLMIPMEYDPHRACETVYGWKDPRTTEGELLHPERDPRAEVEKEKTRLGTFGASGQLQQLPAPSEGGMFKKLDWRFWRHPGVKTRPPRPMNCDDIEAVDLPKLGAILISVDANFKETTDGSRVGLLVLGFDRANVYVLDNRTGPMDFPKTITAIRQLRKDYPLALRILIEDKANGSAIISTLQNEISGIIPILPEGGKESRASAVQPTCESHNVYLHDGAPWLDSFVGELAAFPKGKHDDQVDALTQALIYMQHGLDYLRSTMMSQL